MNGATITTTLNSTEQIINSSTTLKGKLVDTHTRCEHYHSKLDIIALKFKCCHTYYPCYKCHGELAHHKVEKFNEADLLTEKVVLCGNCYSELTFDEYTRTRIKDKVEAEVGKYEDACYVQTCVHCNSPFNPNCSFHYDLYFELS